MKNYKNILVSLISVGVLLLHTLAFGLSLEERVKEYSLDNGMKILILERHFAPVVSLYMSFKVGAVDEAGGEIGTAHLLEHMLFKGTETLGTKDYKEEKKILEKIDQLAGQIDKEMKKGGKANESKIAELKGRLKTLQEEHKKWVVKDEIDALYSQNGAEGLNASTGYDVTTYKVSLPANRIGCEYDIKFLKKERVKHIFQNYYCPNNAVVAVVGDINPDEVMKTIEKYFGEIPPERIVPVPVSEEPEQAGERRVEVEFDANPKLAIGYHKPALPHFDDYVCDVIDILLSDGRTSRLYKKLVEEKKIAVSISTANGWPGSRYANLFTLFATPRSPHTCNELEEEIYTQIDRLKKEAVTPYELNKVKNRLEAGFIRSLNSNAGLAGRLSYYQTIAGDWRYIEDHLKVIEKVTPEDIMEVAKKYFIKKNRTVAQIVKKEDND
jgi:predicted Zn-dependent peptidase